MAERHWRELRPGTVREMEALALQMEKVQNMTPQQPHDRAWEMIREDYILLPPGGALNASNYRIRAEDRLVQGSLN